jgi:hypothetical protein
VRPRLFLHSSDKKQFFALEGAPDRAHALAGRRVRVSYSGAREVSRRVKALSVLDVEAVQSGAEVNNNAGRRLASDSLVGAQLSQLDLPGDTRWLSPSVRILAIIVDMCGKSTQPATTQVNAGCHHQVHA